MDDQMENGKNENTTNIIKILDRLLIEVSGKKDWQGTLSVNDLFRIARLLENKLDVIVVPTLGVPIRPNSFDYIFREVEKTFDSYQKIMLLWAKRIQNYQYSSKMEAIPEHRIDDVTPYWKNDYFHPGDAILAYSVVACYRPKRILEIGCGNSTKFMRQASQDYHVETEITCIDPEPRENIKGICDKYYANTLADVNPNIFRQLGPGDILFIDGSHLVMNGSDCVHFFLNILPTLPEGIWVHLHDIFLPYDYPYQLFHDCKSNEQYMLAMLFLYSKEWIPIYPIYYAHKKGILPHGGGSFWMMRCSDTKELGI